MKPLAQGGRSSRWRALAGLALVAALLVGAPACGSDDTPASERTEGSPATTAASPATDTTGEPSAVAPSTIPDVAEASQPSDGSTMDDPTIGVARALDPDSDSCDLLDGDLVADTAFGAVGEPEPMADTVPGSDGCRVAGVNHGELTFAIAPLSEFDGQPSPDGDWALIGGNTAYVFCSDDQDLNDQACAAFVALDDESMLTVFAFLPVNSIDHLGTATRTVTAGLLEQIPEA